MENEGWGKAETLAREATLRTTPASTNGLHTLREHLGSQLPCPLKDVPDTPVSHQLPERLGSFGRCQLPKPMTESFVLLVQVPGILLGLLDDRQFINGSRFSDRIDRHKRN